MALIEPLASTVCLVACWMAVILLVMSSVARAVWAARLFTSWATTAKPRPASPARAASMVAFKRQQIGLAGDVADQAEDRFDRLDMARQGAG